MSDCRERESLKWSHQYVDQIPQSAFLIGGGTGEILHANRFARSAYGLGHNDMGRATIERLGFPTGSSQDLETTRLLGLKPGETARFTYSVPTTAGAGYASVAAAAVADQKGDTLILMMVMDATPEWGPRQQADVREATLRALVDANFAVCYDWDVTSGQCVFWGRFDELLGLEEEEHPSSIDAWLQLVHPDDVERVAAKNQESIDSLQPYLDEYRMVHKDGRTVVVWDSGQLISDERGAAVRMVGGIRNITREREMQRALEERSVALRVILNQRGQDRLELERNIHENVNRLVIPALDRIRHSLGGHPQTAQIDTLRQTLEEIVRPFARRLIVVADGEQPLTPRELEVLELVRIGRTTQEIAELLFLSTATVSFHRANIRKKLGIPRKRRRLATHLATMEQHGIGLGGEDSFWLGESRFAMNGDLADKE